MNEQNNRNQNTNSKKHADAQNRRNNEFSNRKSEPKDSKQAPSDKQRNQNNY